MCLSCEEELWLRVILTAQQRLLAITALMKMKIILLLRENS